MSGASREPDMELKKAFMELQQKMQNTNQSIRLSDMQIETLKRQIMHAQLTDKEIQAVPDETRVYDGIGRMFIRNDVQSVRKNLEKKQVSHKEKIAKLESNKQYLEKSLKESENNLRELIKTKQKISVS
ncbi:prefoldin subunit 1-like [Pollicipes pollicipes]|uniref:prefoldin subunit 1-like n=1 Tax=Pollicipes pollicipes TaxID=41117 RepID=UPI001884996C|nr:prefoldin subunit 1-like [Pollicipes pollicipes]XP_037073719.1 prefoldin subunit 1-like [Pollicipes pollicipes]XP_037077003.1 prefoldin subunit 1-like [Pollicipes pollicipes]